MRVPAPAKINLHLRVGPPRADGFHPLLTWMVTVGLFDTLILKLSARTQRVRASSERVIALTCNHPELPTDGRNLVVRAATVLADHAGRVGEDSIGGGLAAVSAFLNKRIPSGAGLGGGSSDAAAALIGLNRLWRLGFSGNRLGDIGAMLGSDVPFFLHGPSSVCSGRGEVVRPVAPPDMGRGTNAWAVLVLPKIELSTPAVYRRFDEMTLGRDKHLTDEPDWAGWSKLSAGELMARLANDLEAPAFDLSPPLRDLKDALESGLGRIVRMSGSGSSLFSLCDGGAEEAIALAQRVRDISMVDATAVPICPISSGESHDE